jgi:glycine cleavage system H protein
MSDKFEVREGLLYTKDHEWAKTTQGGVEVGITAYAVDQLGDITLVNIDVKVGEELAAGKPFGTIESVKTLSDLYAPVGGTVIEINAALESQPELVNEDSYGKGWMIIIAPSPGSDQGALLSASAYGELLKLVAH